MVSILTSFKIAGIVGPLPKGAKDEKQSNGSTVVAGSITAARYSGQVEESDGCELDKRHMGVNLFNGFRKPIKETPTSDEMLKNIRDDGSRVCQNIRNFKDLVQLVYMNQLNGSQLLRVMVLVYLWHKWESKLLEEHNMLMSLDWSLEIPKLPANLQFVCLFGLYGLMQVELQRKVRSKVRSEYLLQRNDGIQVWCGRQRQENLRFQAFKSNNHSKETIIKLEWQFGWTAKSYLFSMILDGCCPKKKANGSTWHKWKAKPSHGMDG